jgi:methylglyoxal synthase
MMKDEFISFTMDKTKHIALVAHDGKKKELVAWCEKNKDILKNHFLCGTGTTAKLIAEQTGLPVKGYCSGPLGGDQQIGCRIVEGGVDFLIFLWDPLESQPHDPDVKALLRIAVVYDIPVANNLATADFMLASKYMNGNYERNVENFNVTIQDRVNQFQGK